MAAIQVRVVLPATTLIYGIAGTSSYPESHDQVKTGSVLVSENTTLQVGFGCMCHSSPKLPQSSM